jgi:hypothetical protein
MNNPMDYQGNTKKDRERSEQKAKPEKNIEKVVTETVVMKPKPLGRKFKDMFFGGDAKQAARYVTGDVLLPALRNLIFDMVTKGVEGLIWGESRQSRRPQNVNYGTRYRYDSRSYPGEPRDRAFRPDPINIPSRMATTSQNRYEMNEVIVSSREEADLVIERLSDILETYDAVSLADLYELLGLDKTPIHNKWGWNDITGTEARQVRQGYLLVLPPLEEL